MARKKKSSAVLELPISYSGLSIGEKTCRLGVSVSRANYSVSAADTDLCERRLTVKLLARHNGAPADQGSLPGLDNDREITAVADVKGFSASGRAISFGLTFMLASVDVEVLSHFPKRDGRMVVESIDAIPEEEKGQQGEQDEEADEEA